MKQLMTFEEARKLKDKYRCSSCWSVLDIFPADNGAFTVRCMGCGDNSKGFVTQRFVEKRKEANAFEAMNAKYVLSQAVPWMKSKDTEEEILRKLGF